MSDLFEQKRDVYSEEQIFTDNSPRRFSGEHLAQIRFPLGGIGTGTVSLGGRGELRDWEIFNRPNRDSWLPFNLFIARVTDPDRDAPAMKVLEREWLPSFDGTRGLPEQNAPGLPRFRQAEFIGEYPVATLCLKDPDVPLDVRLEALNPLIPHDLKAGSLPAALFIWEFSNPTDRPLTVDLYSTIYNACGYDGTSHVMRQFPGAGGNMNVFRRAGALSGIAMSNERLAPDDAHFGTMALSTTWTNTSFQLRLEEKVNWWTSVQDLWDSLGSGAPLPDGPEPKPSPDGETQLGVLGCTATVRPGGMVRIPVFLTWHFPNRGECWGRTDCGDQPLPGNYYATHFADAWDVAVWLTDQFARLYDGTHQFRNALFGSSIPGYALESITATLAALRTNSCFVDREGRFYGYEGCCPQAGCCAGTCTHVWNYAQTVAWLFPELERSARRIEFCMNTTSSGAMPFRTPLPPGVEEDARFMPAADGQMGAVLRAYREWRISGDEDFLRDVWSGVRRAMEFAWQAWDVDRDGLMEEAQHNTTDIEFYGPNPYCSGMYVAALEAAAQMAEAVGEAEAAVRFRDIAGKGRRNFPRLWNGEYFEQEMTEAAEANQHQLGAACCTDQIMGQWLADLLGLPGVVSDEHAESVLRAIFTHNWQTPIRERANVRRAFAVNDEQALVYCTWPRGGKPHHPIFRSSEVWTGQEYMVAGHLIQRGMIKEGLSIVRAIRERHNGHRRNPWNECECGDHYVRAMSSWSVLTALAGFDWSAPEARIAFAPRLSSEDFRCFWSTGGAWGTFAQRRSAGKLSAEITVLYGTLVLRRAALQVPDGASVSAALLGGAKQSTRETVRASLDGGEIRFEPDLVVAAGKILDITAAGPEG